MRPANANRVSHFWASQNTPYLYLGTELWETNIYIGCFSLKQYKIPTSYRDFCRLHSFCLCTPLLTLAKSFFSSTYLLKLSSSKTLVTRWNVFVVITSPQIRICLISFKSKFLIMQFLVKCCKLQSIFKIPSKSHMLDNFT